MIFAKITHLIEGLDTKNITEERKSTLDKIITILNSNSGLTNIQFICTHNSRRSFFAQVWAQVLAEYYGRQNIQSYSGGTEETAIYPEVLNALKNQGFLIESLQNSSNPIHVVKYSPIAHPILGFSKKTEAFFNPSSDFLAVMVCSSADTQCPLLSGSFGRVSLPFTDPKCMDNTPKQAKAYMDKSLEIATELKYVFMHL